MLGLLPVDTSFARRRMTLGYRVARLCEAGVLGPAGTVLVGHEFHYATVSSADPANLADTADADANDLGPQGHRSGLVSGTFFHAIAPAPDGPPRPDPG
jgi:cobyrinic acid a,c-diamide synthase